jgi:hypothetical protein
MPITKPKRRSKSRGFRSRHSATKEATTYIPDWFKKVINRVGLSALSLAEAYVWFRVIWSVNDRILFRDFYWRGQLVALSVLYFD